MTCTPQEALELMAAGDGYTVDPVTGCWIWSGSRPITGLGPFLAFYEAANGPAPKGFEPVHACAGAEQGCVCPQHLTLAPTNARDRRLFDGLSPELADQWPRRIREEREARGHDRYAMARELGVSYETIRGWETGAKRPAPDVAARVSRRLGWNQPPRDWIVTLVHQAVVHADSAGSAVRVLRDRLDQVQPTRPLKTAVYSVRLVDGQRRRKRR